MIFYRGDNMFCTNCGNNINEDAKFCQYCGMKTVLASKDSLTENTIPDYPGEEYTVVYSRNGQGESRVKKLSDRQGYQPDAGSADGQDRGGFYESQTRPAHGSNTAGGHAQGTDGMDSIAPNAFGSAEAYTSKVFNSPVLGVAGVREGNSGRELSEKADSKGNGILIALIVILVLLILLVGFSAFAYIQGLIDF